VAPTFFGAVCGITGGGSQFQLPVASGASQSTETFARRTVRKAGVLSGLCVNVTSGVTPTPVWTARKNNVNATVTVSLSSASIFNDLTHSDSFASTDTMDWSCTGTVPVYGVSALYTGNNNATVSFAHSTYTTFNAATSTFISFGGQGSGGVGVESGVKTPIRAPATSSNMLALVTSNASTTARTLTSRKNAAAGNQTVSITASTTGAFEDTTHTDSVVSGDFFNYSIGTGTTGSTVFSVGCIMTGTTDEFDTGCLGSGTAFSSSGNIFSGIMGSGVDPGATEATKQLQLNTAGSLRALRWGISGNSNTGAVTVTLRKNGANGNLVLSIPASNTGTFEDTTHADTFFPADLLNLQYANNTAGMSGAFGLITAKCFNPNSTGRNPYRPYLRR